MVWWRKRNEGFEWRDYVRTTILVRRENRRQRLKEAKHVAAEGVKNAGKRGVEAGVSGAKVAGSAAWSAGRQSAGTLAEWSTKAGAAVLAGAAALGRGTAAAAGWAVETLGRPLGPVLEPVLTILRTPRAKLAAAVVVLLTGLGAAYRTWSFGFDADAAVAATICAVTAVLLLLALLTDPDRARRPSHVRDSLLKRLGAGDRTLPWQGWSPTPRATGIAVMSLAAIAVLAGIWHLLPEGSPSRTTSAPLTTAALPDPSKLEGRAVALTGDTLRIGGKRVRLDGIEAPEATQSCARGATTWRCGAAAKEALASLVRNRRVSCEITDERDAEPRARCAAQGNDLAEELVKAGSVFAIGGFLAPYSSAESKAQDAKAGVWAGGEAERPQDFRDKQWEAAKKAAPDGCPIKGRIRAGARVYVLPWVSGYGNVKIRTSRGERWFCSEDEAVAAGWRRENPS